MPPHSPYLEVTVLKVETGCATAQSFPVRGRPWQVARRHVSRIHRRSARPFALWREGRFLLELEWYSTLSPSTLLPSVPPAEAETGLGAGSQL